MALAFCISLNRILAPYIIGLIILNWLLEARFIKKYRYISKSLHRQDTLLFGALYFSYLVGMIYTSNMVDGLFSLQVKLSLIIFPILFATIDVDFWDSKKTRSLLISFIAGCFAASLYCLFDAFIIYLDTLEAGEFYFGDLSEFNAPSYSSMYLAFAIVVLLWFLLEGEIIKRNWLKVIVLLLIVYFSVFSIMLSSKAGVLILAIIFFLTISYIIFIRRQYIRGLIVMLVITLLFSLLLKVLPFSMIRINYAVNKLADKENITNNATDGTVKRVLVWKYSLELIDRHFFIGVGTGDVLDALLEIYEEKSFGDAVTRALNSHNQYLQTFVALGILGFLVLVLSLLLPAILCVRRKNFIYLCFLVIIGSNFLVESMLERQAGVVFYAFFNAMLFSFSNDYKRV